MSTEQVDTCQVCRKTTDDCTDGICAMCEYEKENAVTTEQKQAHTPGLPPWWGTFIQNVCEIPDRTSPEDEPEAMIATAGELESCALAAIAKATDDTGN